MSSRLLAPGTLDDAVDLGVTMRPPPVRVVEQDLIITRKTKTVRSCPTYLAWVNTAVFYGVDQHVWSGWWEFRLDADLCDPADVAAIELRFLDHHPGFDFVVENITPTLWRIHATARPPDARFVWFHFAATVRDIPVGFALAWSEQQFAYWRAWDVSPASISRFGGPTSATPASVFIGDATPAASTVGYWGREYLMTAEQVAGPPASCDLVKFGPGGYRADFYTASADLDGVVFILRATVGGWPYGDPITLST